jgi:hypothetical protein
MRAKSTWWEIIVSSENVAETKDTLVLMKMNCSQMP